MIRCLIPVYEVLGFIGMGNHQELYLDLNLISDPGIAVIKDGKATFRGTGYNGFAMEIFPSKLVSLTGYYNGYLFYIFNQQNQLYYQSVSADQSDWNEWKVIDLNNGENPEKIKELFNAKMIDHYVYVQDENKLIEINLKEVLE